MVTKYEKDILFREIKKRIDYKKSKTLSFPPHIHDDIEFVFVKKDRTAAYCDGKKYTLKENSFFLVFPNQVHHYSECVDGEYIVIIIKPSKLFSYKEFFEYVMPASTVLSFEKG